MSNSFPVHPLVLSFNKPIKFHFLSLTRTPVSRVAVSSCFSGSLFLSGLGKIWRAKHQFRINLLALELIIQSVGVCVEVKIINS